MRFGYYGELQVSILHVYRGKAYIVGGISPELLIVPEVSVVYA